MKTLRFILFNIVLLFPLLLFAEVTREQADAVVLEYIQNEVTWDCALLRNDNPQDEDGKTSVTWTNSSLHSESLSVEYPCWVYFAYNPNVNGPYTVLFLFVSKEDGTLLEIESKQAFIAESENWTEFGAREVTVTAIGKADESPNIVISPNPVSDLLNIISNTGISRIEIYDISGRLQLVELVQCVTNYRLNISSLAAGKYLLNIADATGKLIKKHKLIKN